MSIQIQKYAILLLISFAAACVDQSSAVVTQRVDIDPYLACEEQAAAWCPRSEVGTGGCTPWYMHACMTSVPASQAFGEEAQALCLADIESAGPRQRTIPCSCQETWGVTWCQ